VTGQRPVLEPALLQIQQADELLPDMIGHGLRGPRRLGKRGGLVDLREVTRIGDRDHLQAAGAGGFFELPVGAEALEGGGEPAACLGQPVLADGPGGHGGLLVDDQVRVGGAWPPVAAVLQPGQQEVAGQVIEGRAWPLMTSRRLPRSMSAR
jgi:hypothetical protein